MPPEVQSPSAKYVSLTSEGVTSATENEQVNYCICGRETSFSHLENHVSLVGIWKMWPVIYLQRVFCGKIEKLIKWCPVSRHSWLHFLLMSVDPSPHLLKKDAFIWSRDQLGNVPLRPKATCCHMVFGAGGVMLELFSNNKETACYDWKQQWLVSWEWSQTKTVNWSR